MVQLWSFQVESKLCLALVKVNISFQGGRKEGVSQSKGNEKGASSSGQEEDYGGLYENELWRWFYCKQVMVEMVLERTIKE